jgi:PAS domain S-box-containing protein
MTSPSNDLPAARVSRPEADRQPEDPALRPSDAETLELVAQVIDLLPDFFYVHDYDMRFWYANRRAANYFGYEHKEDLVGRRLEDVDPHPEQGQFFAETCRRVMREGVPRLTDDLPYVRRDGTPGFLRQHDIPFLNPKTGEMMLIGLSRDVTGERDLATQRLRAAQLDRELSIATQIQQAFSPNCGSGIEGVHVSAWARPAQYAGGDFYDWGPGRGGAFCFGIGDATGHGVGPALIASACRAYARVLSGLIPIEEILSQLNGQIAFDLSDGRFVTFAIASLDPADFRYTLVSAGHGPTFIISRGELIQIDGQSPPLGLLEDLSPDPPATGTLQPGDAIIMLSDGVFESPGTDGTPVGLQRLRHWVKDLANLPAPQLTEALSGRLINHLGDVPLRDDATIVVVTRDP